MPSQSLFRRLVRIFRIGLLCSCACCLLIALGFAIHTSIFLKSAVRATGDIVGLEERVNHENENVEYAPIFHFVAEDGKPYTVISNTATYPAGFAQGDKVQVLYRKSNPAGATIDSFRQVWLVPMVLLFIGIIHGIIGGGLWLVERSLVRKDALRVAQISC